jgi:two-component system NarL family response regulator
MLLRKNRAIQIVAQASNGREAVAQFLAHRPSVTILDLRMPGGDGIEAMAEIRRLDPNAAIVVFTLFDDEESIYLAFARGARGYLLKHAQPEEIVACIECVAQGLPWIPAEISAKLAKRLSRSDLSPRETDVLKHLAAGQSNKEIADQLSISESTVKAHVDHILKKLRVQRRSEAVALAARIGLIHME